ncbi:sulfite exporter TauE/SafE family protein [Natrialbaceae archaeon AArc-T1-2]|uniref:sulfite exporter TauE/SafE family protein n=1 Tax=Natrialbaceae archaeon AArc-T1-2 TaxID=3053904 RepID=UPI00255AEF8C|nr:sulfite exporter TauE/SafE family protein [Natrialbaceae archaeon AArc-T1-2]WIV67253.1 sulfite exporter TauE/SafE family protein [Natrialbaceae archaeon AArc-T1-2]
MTAIVPLETCLTPGVDPAIGAESLGLAVFFLVGLLGGAHCLGMCGPLVTTYADRLREDSRRETVTVRAVRQHALFNLGRTASYALVGGLFGFAGSVVFVTGTGLVAVMAEIHAALGLFVGAIIVAMGVHYLAGRGVLGGSVGIPVVGSAVGRLQSWLLARVDGWVGGPRIAGLGAAHGLLPCPLLYPAFLYAFVQGSAVGGALSLAALGVGTIPSLFLYGTLFQSVSVETRLRLHRVLGVAFIALGYIPLQHGLAVMGITLPHPPIPYYQPI